MAKRKDTDLDLGADLPVGDLIEGESPSIEPKSASKGKGAGRRKRAPKATPTAAPPAPSPAMIEPDEGAVFLVHTLVTTGCAIASAILGKPPPPDEVILATSQSGAGVLAKWGISGGPEIGFGLGVVVIIGHFVMVKPDRAPETPKA